MSTESEAGEGVIGDLSAAMAQNAYMQLFRDLLQNYGFPAAAWLSRTKTT